MTDDRPLHERRIDGGIDVFKQSDGHYEIHTGSGETLIGGTLNIGGRAAALAAGDELCFGGGDATIIVRVYPDGRTDEGHRLLAIGFETEAVL
jgi:hypothetical protein